ncbi:MAG TPA: extensin family protein [Polyangiales bacterium]|nr:extensin family protein [Polyangiales bacterium]
MSVSLSGCLFPVIDFDDHSAPQSIAMRARPAGYAHVDRQATKPVAARITTLPARQHAAPRNTDVSRRTQRPSVIAPDVPVPEVQMPSDMASCHQRLRSEGIRFRVIAPALAKGVRWPIRLTGDVGGVVFEPGDPDDTFAVLDCRLALVLNEWAGDLRRAGVRRVGYYSMYRPGAHIGGGPRISGHAHGMAIDAARFTLKNGAVLNVLENWEGRDRGDAPCPTRSEESSAGRLLRDITCSAADRNLFQVVLTPHYNSAHDNHVHLEIKPEVDWTYVR